MHTVRSTLGAWALLGAVFLGGCSTDSSGAQGGTATDNDTSRGGATQAVAAGGSTQDTTSGGTGNEDSTAVDADYNYTGPGSFYDADINTDGTYSIQVSEGVGQPVLFTISGSYTRLSTGFLRMLVEDVQGSADDAPSVGDEALALEVPGFALLLRPLGGQDIIPMLVSGNCPTEDFDANWIIAQSPDVRDATDPERDWFGTFSYDYASASAFLPAKYNLATFADISESIPKELSATSCEQGRLTIAEDANSSVNMWLTDGGAIVEVLQDGQKNETVLAMLQRPMSMADLQGSYAAFVLQGPPVEPGTQGGTSSMGDAGMAPGEAPEPFPAVITLDDQGAGTGRAYDDVVLGVTGDDGVEFAVGNPNDPADGWLKGTIGNGEGGSGNLACSALTDAADSGKTVIFCIGQDPGQPQVKFTLVMVGQ